MNEVKGVIYKASSPSGKVYIGQTIRSFQRRMKAHLSEAFNLNSGFYNTRFGRAIRKYGDQLSWEILHENVSIEQLDVLERQEISKHDSFNKGYNGTMGGTDGGFRGRKHTKESKKILSQQKIGENNPMHGKKGELNPFYGKKHSEATKDLMKQNHSDVSGENNPMYGKRGKDNPNYGRKNKK